MRRQQKVEVLEVIQSLFCAHEEIRASLQGNELEVSKNMLVQLQEYAIELGNIIDSFEGEGSVTVKYLEDYCTRIFELYNSLDEGLSANQLYKKLGKSLLKVENSVNNDIPLKKEIVFFPYKASMWDSFESVYIAAKEDPECDAYCVPIPYYDMTADRKLGLMHYEGDSYPEYVEIVDWKTYIFEERRPEIIYIHNPYDQWNFVTSIHPRFYSENLKKYTDLLIYIPYFATAGTMSTGQSFCSAYVYSDYLVVQSKKMIDFYDASISRNKFLALGSPKFDTVIKKCKNPIHPPVKWKEKIAGKRVFFFNTSIGGMLDNTDNFLKKMEYVFHCFKEKEDVCLLWRPHPLLENTFDSLRPGYKSRYMDLKEFFIENAIGIFDDTTDIADSISWSHAYMGDAASSLVSLFGIVGKPIFILNNQIHSVPTELSWRGEIVPILNYMEQDRYTITQGNKLYISEPFEYQYKYYCNLSKYGHGSYYSSVWNIDDRLYVTPMNAQDILVLDGKSVSKKIEFKDNMANQTGAFQGSFKYDKYLVVIPLKYPSIVVYDTSTDKIRYFDKFKDVFLKEDEKGSIITGASRIHDGILYLSSPTNHDVYKLHINTGIEEVMELPQIENTGWVRILEYRECLWFFPYKGKQILCWNPKTGNHREYRIDFEGFKCVNPVTKEECDNYPFSGGAFYNNTLLITPNWGNLCLGLNFETQEVFEWKLPYEETRVNDYYNGTSRSCFTHWFAEDAGGTIKLFSPINNKLYKTRLSDFETNEINIQFDVNELKQNENGFCIDSQWLNYCCFENAFNSIPNFLDGIIIGNAFDQKLQIDSYREISENSDGNCGENIHFTIMDKHSKLFG